MGTCISTHVLSDTKSEGSPVPAAQYNDENLIFIPRPVPIDLMVHEIAPAVHHPSHVHRNLVPDMILEVLKDLSKHDLASAMRVCRSWSDVCCIILWKTLDSPVPLFKLLSPMKREANGWGYITARQLNWTRFKYYHSHVRSLSNVPGSFPISPLAYSHVAIALRDEPKILPLGLVPNLHTLILNITTSMLGAVHEKQLMMNLFTSTLSRLTLRLGIWYTDTLPEHELQLLLTDIHARCPKLSRIEASYPSRSRSRPENFERIGSFIGQQPELRELSLDTGGFRRDWMQYIGQLQKLRSFAFAANFDTVGDINEFFRSLVDTVPKLQVLECGLGDHGTLSFGLLRPLFRLSQLTTLVVKHEVDLSAQDVRNMAVWWKSLEKLHLGSDKGFSRVSSPGSILLTIAECFPPTFSSLNISLDWKDGVPKPPTGYLTGGRPPSMNSLTMNIPDALVVGAQLPELAEFLASVTASGVRIELDTRWLQERLDLAVRAAHRSLGR